MLTVQDSVMATKVKGAYTREPRGRRSLDRTLAADNILSMLEEELKLDGGDSEGSDISAADPDAILQTLKDIDDMDADLFAPKKRSVLVARPRPRLNQDSGAGDEATSLKEPPVTAHNTGKRTSSDEPVSDLLNDLIPDDSKPEPKGKVKEPLVTSPSLLNPETNKPSQRRAEVTFEEDKDDLMDALGFDRDEKESKRKDMVLWSNKPRRVPPQRARTKVDEILDGLSSSHLSSESKDQEEEKPQDRASSVRDDALGSYQPTIGSDLEGRQSRRQSVRFSSEDVSVSTPERKPNQAPRPRGSADWLGLKTNHSLLQDDAQDSKFSMDSPLLERKSSLTRVQATNPATKIEAPTETEVQVPKTREDEEDDWLSGALSRKKSTPKAEEQEEQPPDLGGLMDLESFESAAASSLRTRADPGPAAGEPKSADLSAAVSRATTEGAFPHLKPVPTGAAAAQQQLIQAQLPRAVERPKEVHGDHQALQSRISQLEGHVKALQLERDQSYSLLESVQLRHQRDIELLENAHKDRVKILEESAAQRETRQQEEYQDLMERMSSLKQAAEEERAQLQLLYQQKLSQAQQERDREVERLRELQRKSILEMKKDHEDQVRRLKKLKEEEIDAVTSATSQTRSLTAVIEQMEHFSLKLGEISSRVESTHEHTAHDLEQGARHRDEQLRIMQDRVAQQQKSMTEERAYLKEIISRMDTQISEQQRQLEKVGLLGVSSCHHLSSLTLSPNFFTPSGSCPFFNISASLTILRLQTQESQTPNPNSTSLFSVFRSMSEMHDDWPAFCLQERWRVSGEQAKAESTLRSLEEERRSLSMQINVEREELDRAKSALLEEQKSVMQQCTEERRKLAAEWSQLHAQEKARQERAERAVSSLLEKREDSIMSLAQEQAEWKLRTAELKQKEASVIQEREQLERLREELNLEKQRISSSALRLNTRVQEVEAFSKLAADRYEQGERALQEATQVEQEHEARLKNIHFQTERLRQHEKRVLQERLSVPHREQQKQPTRRLPKQSGTLHCDISASYDGSESLRGKQTSAAVTVRSSQSMALAATLALWKYTAAKDREYLEEEQIFLENLKKKPYRWTNGADRCNV
ncbi:fas-binding factor 1-like isoform X2 [Synchiropus splendidus]|uniref:fas-binding factor 1-like isoform X2 n=1 Tax=Synchiropus splendidus TaxID=270530 RepID=UPI00237EC502|nr:fas-binding factor 1-like isoform X2 [Synchiropus splendidus]